MSTELELKQELLSLLIEDGNSEDKLSILEKIDYGRLLELSSKISVHDSENVRFSVDAKIVERLGEQLVAKKTTALSELIKNAYDADASNVDVDFIGTEQVGGTIIISDSGNGMNFDELVNGFMTISTSDKVSNPTSPLYIRPRAGKKGIGRFSAQKIGKQLKLITKREGDTDYLCVDINWEKFESGSSLSSISNKVFYTNGNYHFEKGTILEITDVKEAWTEGNIKTAFDYISNIIQISPDNQREYDPGFTVSFKCVDRENNSSPILIDDVTEYLSAADLVATAYMKKNGVFEIEMQGLADQNLTETIELKEGFDKTLLSVGYKVELSYFGMAKGDPRPKGLQNYLNNNGGIKFFRNGFNVAPYGESYNDWLGLDESSRRRIILPPHANTNFMGKVFVTDPEGELFEETSSREGVLESDAFKVLVEATKNIALKIASHVATIREKKVTASQEYNSERKSRESKLKEQLETLKKKLKAKEAEEVQKEAEQGESNNSDFDKDSKQGNNSSHGSQSPNITSSELIDDLTNVGETLKEYIDEQLMYRVLSSTGLAISEFTHEIQTCLTNLSLNSQALDSFSKYDPKIHDVSVQLEENLSMLVAYTDFFDGTMRSNSNREKNYYDMRKLIKKFIGAMDPTIKRRGYVLKTHFDSWGIWTKPVHISEIMSIFINLFTNACKAIERAGQKKGSILVDVSTNGSFMTIRFEDNGDGIPKDKWAKVFAPLYTTSIPAKAYASDNEYNRGMGLGLSITEKIISEMNGEIAVYEPSQGYSTCINILLPLADEKELPEDAY